MEIKHLRYVEAIARTRSFSQAAEQLYISQSTLSQQIAKLESELCYALFHRSTKHVRLTPEGTQFLSQAGRVLGEFDALLRLVEGTRAPAHRAVNVGISMIYRPETSGLISRFAQENPAVDLNVVTVWELEMVDMLRRGDIDIGLFGVDWNNDDLTGLTVTPLHDEWVVAAVGSEHKLAGRDSVSLEELSRETVIFTSLRSGVRRLVLQRLRQQGAEPARMLEINEAETSIDYVRQGIGVALAMNSTRYWLVQEDIRMIPVEPKLLRTYSLVAPHTSAGREPGTAEQLKTFLLDNLMFSNKKLPRP